MLFFFCIIIRIEPLLSWSNFFHRSSPIRALQENAPTHFNKPVVQKTPREDASKNAFEFT